MKGSGCERSMKVITKKSAQQWTTALCAYLQVNI